MQSKNDDEGDIADMSQSSNPRVSIQAIMERGRKMKARSEKEMERALGDMATHHADSVPRVPKSTDHKLPILQYDDDDEPSKCGKCVGLVYNNDMLEHRAWKTIDYGRHHPERPERILKPLERLNETDTLSQLYLMRGREAALQEILVMHLEDHVSAIASIVKLEQEEIELQQEKYDSIYLCKDSYYCALLSCGSTLSIVNMVVSGSLRSGFALVRPPGHHAEVHTARGFCIFNNVAIAAKEAQRLAKKNGIVSDEKKYKVLILDWDVHHGNGTQNMFYNDPSVLYISLHRYEHGYFYPSSEDANHDRVGIDDGVGFNVNIPWSDARMGDPEYFLAFEHIVMPVAEVFRPHLVLVSSGFDAGKGDPLGGFKVTPHMYGYMTHRLQSLADGKVVIVLEGGYNLKTVSDSVLACTRALLHFGKSSTTKSVVDYSIPPKIKSANSSGIQCVLNTMKSLILHWTCLKKRVEGIEQIQKDIKMDAVNKLTKGFESLVINETAANTDGGHRYGTRAKSRNSNTSDASQTSSESDAVESRSWEHLEFSPPGTLEVPAPPLLVNESTNSEDAESSSEYLDARTVPGDSFYSTQSTTESFHEGNQRTTDNNDSLSATESLDQQSDTSNNLDTLGACGSTENPEEKSHQLTIILQSLGMTNITGMSLEDKLAVVQAGLSDDASGYTIPKEDCQHVRQDFISQELHISYPCSDCGHEKENWSCLSCGLVFCGRFINRHMLSHFQLSRHPIALSHSDLSFWCYECDSYLNNFLIQPLKEIYKRAHIMKHGTDAPI